MVAENVRMPEIICNREKVPRMFMMCDDVSNRTFVLCLGEPLCSHHL